MRISAIVLCRDIAIIVVLTYVVASSQVFLHLVPYPGFDKVTDLLIILGAAGAAGWLFSSKHGYVSLFAAQGKDASELRRMFILHSAALAAISFLIISAINISLNPTYSQAMKDPEIRNAVVMLLSLSLLSQWPKVLFSMQFGQWVYSRAHRSVP